MKLNIIIFFPILISFFCVQNSTFAQPQLWDIYSVSNEPFINVTADKYESDSLHIKSMNQWFILHQDSIKYILRKREPNFGLGFLLGAITGGILGATNSSGSKGSYDIGFSPIGKGFSVVLGALIGGMLGGVVGLTAGTDEEYHVEKLNIEDKKKLLNRLFN